MSKRSALKRGERCDSDWCEVRHSGIHGRGLFAKQRIPENTAVIQYMGKKSIRRSQPRRGWAQIDLAKLTGDAAVYIFALDDDYDLDGSTRRCPTHQSQLFPELRVLHRRRRSGSRPCAKLPKGRNSSLTTDLTSITSKITHVSVAAPTASGSLLGRKFWTDLKKRLAKPARKKKQKG